MFKKLFPIISIIGIASLGYSANAVAVDTFFQTPPAATTGTSGGVLSPAEFAKEVSESSNKEQAATLQQLNQQLSQVPKPATPPPTSQPESTAPQTQPAMPEQSSQQNTTKEEETEQPTVSTYSAPAPTRVPPPPPPVMQPAPTAQPAQVYTGFSGGGSQTTAPASPSKGTSGGGWNIKY